MHTWAEMGWHIQKPINAKSAPRPEELGEGWDRLPFPASKEPALATPSRTPGLWPGDDESLLVSLPRVRVAPGRQTTLKGWVQGEAALWGLPSWPRGQSQAQGRSGDASSEQLPGALAASPAGA